METSGTASQAARPLSKMDSFFLAPAAAKDGADGLAFSPTEELLVGKLGSVSRDNQTQLFWNLEARHKDGTYGLHGKGYATRVSGQIPLKHFYVKCPKTGHDLFMMSPRWNSRISCMKIPAEAIPQGLSEEEMKAAMTRVSRALDEASGDEQWLANSDAVFAAGKNGDAHPWNPRMDSHGHFVGVFREKGALVGQRPNYYLCAHSDSGQLGEALCEHALKNPNMTLSEFSTCPQAAYVRDVAKRNNRRLLFAAAHELGLNREHLCLEDDTDAVVDESKHEAYPEMIGDKALLSDTCYNFLDSNASARDTVVYYAGTTSLARGGKHCGKYAAQLCGPQKGITLYKLDPSQDYTESRTSILTSKDGTNIKHTHSNAYAAFPIGMGRPRDGVSSEQQPSLKQGAAEQMSRSYIWPDKIEGQMHPAFTAYNNPGHFEAGRNEFVLGKNGGAVRLEPVAVVIPRP